MRAAAFVLRRILRGPGPDIRLTPITLAPMEIAYLSGGERGAVDAAIAGEAERGWPDAVPPLILEGWQRFAKLPEQFGFAIEYTDNATNLRFYEPDFVAVLNDGTHWLIETKGREDIDVAHKDRAARIWSENATLLTNTTWGYLKVPQGEFAKLQPGDFSELAVALG